MTLFSVSFYVSVSWWVPVKHNSGEDTYRDAVNSRYLQLRCCLMAAGRRGDRWCLKSCKQVCPARKTGSYCMSDDDNGESGSGDKARSTEPSRQIFPSPRLYARLLSETAVGSGEPVCGHWTSAWKIIQSIHQGALPDILLNRIE